MQRPIKPLFGKIVPKSMSTVDGIRFKVDYADVEVRHLDAGRVCMQYYGNYLYYMEVWEIQLDDGVVLPFEVLDFSLFLFFMLEGNACFSNAEGEDLAQAEQATCYVTSNAPGKFYLHLSKGLHILTYGCPRLDWLKRYKRSYPLLIDFVNNPEVTRRDASYMKKIDINRAIGRKLFDLWHVKLINEDDLEFELCKRFKQLLKSYYDHLIEKERLSLYTTEEKIIEINNYLKAYFHQPEFVKLTFLCHKFLLTERTFSRNFYKVNKKNLGIYLNDLRLSHACQLLAQTSLSVRKISILCGFKSFNYFSRVFKNRFICSPSHWRRSQ